MLIPTWRATVNGIDAIIGSHSHTNSGDRLFGDYKYLPTIVAAPNGKADLVTQAYRYNNYPGRGGDRSALQMVAAMMSSARPGVT